MSLRAQRSNLGLARARWVEVASARRARLAMTPWRLAAICPAGLALATFLTMSWLYCYGPREIYEEVLRSWGIVPFRAPFLDIGFVLAAWDCTRQGWDVMWHNPCDLLQLPFNYSPLWLVAAPIRLSVRDATAVGWTLDLLFIASLTLLPPPRRLAELALVAGRYLVDNGGFRAGARQRRRSFVFIGAGGRSAGRMRTGGADYRLWSRTVRGASQILPGCRVYHPVPRAPGGVCRRGGGGNGFARRFLGSVACRHHARIGQHAARTLPHRFVRGEAPAVSGRADCRRPDENGW